MNSIPHEFRIAYILHNNVLQMLKIRPSSDDMPQQWPHVLDGTRPEQRDDSETESQRWTSRISSNVNVLLCLAAMIESDLEEILVAALPIDKTRAEFDERAVTLLRCDLIKLSSLERYFEFFRKLYETNPGKLMSDETRTGIRLLFDLRNIIIHASALQGRFVKEPEQLYRIVDDPFYLDVVKTSAKLLGLPPEFYCLPESLLGCNSLIDMLIQCSCDAISVLKAFVLKHWPDLDIRCMLPFLAQSVASLKRQSDAPTAAADA